MMNLNKKQKKGQVYIISLIIAIIFALITSLIIISYTSSEKSKDEYFGTYQSGMIDAIIESDKTMIYLQQSAKYSVNKALKEYTESGAVSIIPENGEEYDYSDCKTYVYNLWNNQDKECFPHLENSFGEYLRKNLNEKLSKTGDLNLEKNINYKYYYDNNISESLVKAISNDKYTFYVFKNEEYKFNSDVKEYIYQNQKISDLKFSGTFIWPVPGYYYVSSCFGYRIVKDGSKYHGGLDIVSGGKKVPVVAAASGTIEELDPVKWGKVRINHGGGFITEYLHLDSINPKLKIGDNVLQGQEIGIMGGRGLEGINNFPIHLHFTIINTNIDPKTNIKGAPAVKIDGWNNKNINPACFLIDQIKNNNVQFDKTSLSCQIELRDKKGNIVDPNQGGPFKFCDIYGTIDTNINCQINENKEWKVTNFYVSKKEVSGNEKIKIITTIENPSDECATLKNTLKFDSISEKYVYEDKRVFNIYKNNEEKKYFNIETECTFTTDNIELINERNSGKCVLLAPSDENKIKYEVYLNIKDIKGRVEKEKKITFEVSKPSNSIQTNNKYNEKTTYDFSMLISNEEYIDVSITQKSIQEFLEKKDSVLKNPIDGKLPSQIIYDASNKNKINPIIILATLQKEQGLITAKTATKDKLNTAMGCGCHDLKKCDPKYSGFENQINCAADTLKKHFDIGLKNSYPYKIEGINHGGKCPSNSNTGENNIIVKNAATYALYKYTPHTYDICIGDGKTGGGNYLFLKIMKEYYKEITGKEYIIGTENLNTEYQQIAINEIQSKGIIGKYFVNPSFVVKVPFDFSLVNNLSIFINNTVHECKDSILGREECLNLKIEEFNNTVAQHYKDNGINISLTRNCEEDIDEKAFNEFIESIEDCALSSDFDCQCDLKKQRSIKIKILSEEDKSLFRFEKSGLIYEVNSFNTYLNEKNELLQFEGKIFDLNFYKKLDSLKMINTNDRKCITQKSKFRLCLKTNYFIEDYDGQSVVKENITLKFSIHIKDNTIPPPITGLELMNMKNSRNSIIISWDEPKINNIRIPDIKSYNIYFSDIVTDYNNNINTIRKNIKYRILELSKGYEKIKDIDLSQNPECEVIENKYCKFKYSIKNIDGNTDKIELHENKLYYIIDKEKFFYIINGSDSYNDLKHGKDKYFVVTAIDFDGNEIDNINESQKIEFGKNLKSIKPVDDLGAGFVIPTISINNDKIQLTFNAPDVYINGEPLQDPIFYKVYSEWICDNILCSVRPPFNHIAESTTQNIIIEKKPSIQKLGVIAIVKKGNIEAKYNKAFVLTIP